jgi:hypothetical protein
MKTREATINIVTFNLNREETLAIPCKKLC